MKIEEILKKVTPEAINKQVKEVNSLSLPAELEIWVERYKKVGGDRGDFIWRWLQIMNKVFVSDGVNKLYKESLIKTKFLFNLFIILIDDVSEKNDSKALLDELLKTPFRNNEIKLDKLSKEDVDYLNFTIIVWHEIENVVKGYPNYKDCEETFDFDVEQLLNAVKFGYLVYNHYYMINEDEFLSYIPWSMQIALDFDIDLMCMPKLNEDERRLYREISLLAQKMGRIGNWVSTWERELENNDYTSYVFPYSLKRGIVTLAELRNSRNGKKDAIREKILKSNAEEYLLNKWDEYYSEIKELSKQLKTVDISKTLGVLEYLIFMHLTSRGNK